MPFLELTLFEHTRAQRSGLSQGLTNAVVQAWAIGADIVTLYFQVLGDDECAHAGALVPARDMRVFIKVHAFPRTLLQKREAARAMTQVVAEVLQLPPKSVAIYFLDRPHQDVSHAGVLAVDER